MKLREVARRVLRRYNYGDCGDIILSRKDFGWELDFVNDLKSIGLDERQLCSMMQCRYKDDWIRIVEDDMFYEGVSISGDELMHYLKEAYYHDKV